MVGFGHFIGFVPQRQKKIKTKSRQMQQQSKMLFLYGKWIMLGNVFTRGKIVHLVFTRNPLKRSSQIKIVVDSCAYYHFCCQFLTDSDRYSRGEFSVDPWRP